MKTDYFISWLTLLSGLCISSVAVYYSVVGLMAIFPAAQTAIMIMGIFLEASLLIATVWLKRYWKVAPLPIKGYLITAIIILMSITSVGIYGFLSRAHSAQSVVSGELVAKVEMIDYQIKTINDNIAAAKNSLVQLDSAVDQSMARTTNQQGAVYAISVRKSQARERNALHKEIESSQAKLAELIKERAPIASQLRSVESEVGPIKYIAALVYGDNVDQNNLEKTVRILSLLIVVVFDPLAVVLLLASQYSFQHIREKKERNLVITKDNSDKQNKVAQVQYPETLITTEEPVDKEVHQQDVALVQQNEQDQFDKEIERLADELEDKSEPFESGGLTQLMYSINPYSDNVRKEIASWRKYDFLQKWSENLFHQKGNTTDFDCEFLLLEKTDLEKLEAEILDTPNDTKDTRFDRNMRKYTLEKIKSAVKEIEKGGKIYYYSRK